MWKYTIRWTRFLETSSSFFPKQLLATCYGVKSIFYFFVWIQNVAATAFQPPSNGIEERYGKKLFKSRGFAEHYWNAQHTCSRLQTKGNATWTHFVPRESDVMFFWKLSRPEEPSFRVYWAILAPAAGRLPLRLKSRFQRYGETSKVYQMKTLPSRNMMQVGKGLLCFRMIKVSFEGKGFLKTNYHRYENSAKR